MRRELANLATVGYLLILVSTRNLATEGLVAVCLQISKYELVMPVLRLGVKGSWVQIPPLRPIKSIT